jgi:hypothetical protein
MGLQDLDIPGSVKPVGEALLEELIMSISLGGMALKFTPVLLDRTKVSLR